MKQFQQFAGSVLMLAVAIGVAAGTWWLLTNKPTVAKAEKPSPAAAVPKVVKDDELNVVRITPEAEKRIGLKLASVEQKPIGRHRVYGGEILAPVGRTIVVSAPLGGMLKQPLNGVPRVGQTVTAREPIFQLFPLLTPDSKATLTASLTDAEGQVANAKTQLDLTKLALDRAKRVLREGASSQRVVEESQAAFDLATKTLEAAVARQTILKKVIGDAETGTATPIVLEAPESGILRTMLAMPGQTVPGGAALFEVMNLSTVWVRVPLPVTDLDSVERTASAFAGKLTSNSQDVLASAKPVVAPPTANPLAGTVDAYYELPNEAGLLTPGQRIGVRVPLKGSATGLTVPWSAIVFDVNGGTWVYEQRTEREFVRRRVAVQYTMGSDAVLDVGPGAGTTVVVAGVQELFGAETGFVK